MLLSSALQSQGCFSFSASHTVLPSPVGGCMGLLRDWLGISQHVVNKYLCIICFAYRHTRVYNYSYSSFYLLGQKRKRVFISAYEFCLFFSSNSLPHPFGGEGQKEEQKAVWCLDACWVKPQQLSMHTQQKNIMSNLSFQ